MVAIKKRTPKRSRVFLHGHLQAKEGPQVVRIRDVSVDGALVEAPSPPPVGEEVQLICHNSNMQGQVAWIDGELFGMEFRTPLEESTLADAMGNQLRVTAPRSYRHNRISPAEEPIATSTRIAAFRKSAD